MLSAFFDGVLPVFAVLAIGYAVGKARIFDAGMAAAINRFVILIAVPLLVFRLLARAPFQDFEWRVLMAFLLSELVAYAAGFLVARKLFKRETREAVLLGLASCFANHLLFVLAIATLLFGERASIPIVAIASVDASSPRRRLRFTDARLCPAPHPDCFAIRPLPAPAGRG